MDEPNYFKDDADHRHEDYEESFDLCMQPIQPSSQSIDMSTPFLHDMCGQGIISQKDEDAKIDRFLNSTT